MTGDTFQIARPGALPSWVPVSAKRYLAHIEDGQSIRSLARSGGIHASTVLRQIRRVETQRDDPLVDEALRCLGRQAAPVVVPAGVPRPQENGQMSDETAAMDDATLHREARRVLRRLCEPGAVLAVAADMEKAVVVRDQPDGGTLRRAVVDRALAQAMALKDWITCDAPGRIARYRITGAGRQALQAMLSPGTAPKAGFAEARQGFALRDEDECEDAPHRRNRYAGIDSPVGALARRRDRSGTPFLGPDLVRAGERLREDFELAQMETRTTQNWDRFLTAGTSGGLPEDGALRGPAAARARVTGALRELGPGLGDVVLLCCCQLEGLETAEKRLGWSARSGKIVLRIALQRLKAHYDRLGDRAGLIG